MNFTSRSLQPNGPRTQAAPSHPLLPLTRTTTVALALAGLFLATSCVTPSRSWRTLIDGRSKEGWQMAGPGDIKLEGGELVTYGGMGLLWYTKEMFADCQIKVVFKPTASNDNSGVFIRIPDRPVDAWFGVNKGYEVQIDNNGDDYHRLGCLYSLSHAQNKVTAKIGEWNTMLITLDGARTRVAVNGVRVTDYTEGQEVPAKKLGYEPERGTRPIKGYIGLQNHGESQHVHFKEVSVRPLR